ncbi:MAG: hypothetical protein QXR30_03665 [Candidatus Woesearchaeota archaeon]
MCHIGSGKFLVAVKYNGFHNIVDVFCDRIVNYTCFDKIDRKDYDYEYEGVNVDFKCKNVLFIVVTMIC